MSAAAPPAPDRRLAPDRGTGREPDEPTAGEALDDTVPQGEAPSPFTRRVWKVAAIAALVVGSFLVLAYAPEAALLVFAAVWFGSALVQSAKGLGRYTHMSPRWNLAAVVVLLLAVLLGTLFAAGWRISGRVRELSTSLGDARATVEEKLVEQNLGGLTDNLPDPMTIAGGLVGGSGGGDGAGTAEQRVFTAPFTFGVYALFIFFAGLFLAISPAMYRDGAVDLFPDHQRAKLRDVMNDSGAALWAWTKARLVAMAITGTLTGLALWALGIPLALTLGALTALLVFVPNIGSLLAAVPPVLIAFEQGGLTPLWVLLAYVGVQMLESYVITPYVIGEGTGVPPALVITAQLVFGILFGALGVLFATPIVLVTMIFVTRYWIHGGLGHTEVEVPGAD